MKKEKTTMIKEDELKQIYGGCIEEPSLKTGPRNHFACERCGEDTKLHQQCIS